MSYYQTFSVDNMGRQQFATVRMRDQRIVFGPLSDEQRVVTETVKRNANDGMRVCLALAAGRDLFAQAMMDPTAGAALVKWRPGANNSELAQLDGNWFAAVTHVGPDQYVELQLYYGGRPVGSPVLFETADEAKARVLHTYAARAV